MKIPSVLLLLLLACLLLSTVSGRPMEDDTRETLSSMEEENSREEGEEGEEGNSMEMDGDMSGEETPSPTVNATSPTEMTTVDANSPMKMMMGDATSAAVGTTVGDATSAAVGTTVSQLRIGNLFRTCQLRPLARLIGR